MTTTTLAVIGLGRIARSHISGIQQCPERCELGAVVDIDKERAKAFAEEFDTQYYTSTEDVYADPDIDGVIICVPHHLHAELTTEACEAGKHVLVEKVMATSVEEGKEMVEAARKNDVNLMIGQSRRFFPAFKEAHRRREEIGRPIDLSYHWALYFDSSNAPPWWDSEEKTGGPVYTMLGSHSVDHTLWMLDDREPVSVYANGESNNPDFGGDDYATIVIGFDDGTHATNVLSLNNKPEKHDCLITGTEGSILWEQYGNLSGSLVGTSDTDLWINGDQVELESDAPHNFALQIQEFVNSIDQNRTPRPSGEEILPVLEVIYAARTSSAENRIIDLRE